MKQKDVRRGAKRITAYLLSMLLVVATVLNIQPAIQVQAAITTPVQQHGQLSVSGTKIVDQNGNPFQLRGISTHGINWDVGYPYVNQDSFQTLRDDWGANAVRLAMYTADYNGYCSGGDQTALKNTLYSGVEYATNLGMYVIIDWHILNDNNPNQNIDTAKVFFDEVSEKYKDYNNVLYEICNEPNNCSWDEIKTYANTVIPIIRENDPDAIIIVGTPVWSQLGYGNEVADSPLTGYSNLVYTLHFYCAEAAHTQNLPSKLDYAIGKGLPVLVSEFGLSEASGDGSIDTTQAATWMEKLDSYGIGYFCWSLSNKPESASLISSSCSKTSGWTESDLTDAGKFIRTQYQEKAKEESAGSETEEPEDILVTSITLSAESIKMETGDTEKLTATVTPDNATNQTVNWSSDNWGVVGIDSKGNLTAYGVGTTTVRCTTADGSNITKTCTVTVTAPVVEPEDPKSPEDTEDIKATNIRLSKSSVTTAQGRAFTLKAAVEPDDATNTTVEWSSSDESIATVDETGRVRAIGTGTVTITCSATDGSNVSATCIVTIKAAEVAVKKIKISKTNVNMTQGTALTLKTVIAPSNATNTTLKWTSSNTNVVTVSSTGRIRAKAAGTAVITCKTTDGSGVKATCRVRVYTNTEAYVARVYTKALGRDAEEGGLNYWTSEINNKNRTPVAVAEEFFFAEEFTNKNLNDTEYVKVLYRTFMGREYDQAGLNYWVDRLQSGESRQSVLESFAGCPEFQNIVASFGL